MVVLDKGEVELVDYCASDQMVLRAMLVSTGKDDSTNLSTDYIGKGYDTSTRRESVTDIISRNRGRINYLMREHHGTPFEHNFFCFRIKAPIFVIREWHRHRIGWSYNEQSGRYMELGPEWYIPDANNIRTRVGKPGHYTYEVLDNSTESGFLKVKEFRETLDETCAISYRNYKSSLAMVVAPEQARMFLHVNHYSSFYASCNARSLMHFLALRNAPTAQWEIQQYAEALEIIFAEKMPVTYKAYVDNGRIAP